MCADVVISRNNWEFTCSPVGVDASAIIYSLVETAKVNGLEPYAHLNSLLILISGRNYRSNRDRMEQLLLWLEFMQGFAQRNFPN
ncbi:MAG: transposase domain-containing protein [Saccharofermentanales bacterium]